MNFDEWYQSLDVLHRPCFTDMLDLSGRKYRIVYVDFSRRSEQDHWNLFHLSDYVVSSVSCEVIYLWPRATITTT
jgi:hypothetical protein